MTPQPKLDIVGSALAVPSRARILCELMGGRAYTNKELAGYAGITPQTATGHLKQLEAAGLVASVKSGRCLYHTIASDAVASMLESLATLTPTDHLYRAGCRKPSRAQVLILRSCYNHLAGRLAVAITDTLLAQGALTWDNGHFMPRASPLWNRLAVDIPTDRPHQAAVRCCLDWTERRHHLAGSAGTQLMQTAFARSWVQRPTSGRGLTITPKGQMAFEEILNIRPDTMKAPPT
jgi:DNA-binding MarR family transcriptional regulator